MDSSAHSQEKVEERMDGSASVWCSPFEVAAAAVSEGADYADIDSIPSGHTSYALKPILFTV